MSREGTRGGEALRHQLDEVAERIGGHRKTFLGRLHYMTRSAKGRAALEAHGLEVTPRTMAKWLAGGKSSKANRVLLDEAYADYRRENVVRAMKTRLRNGGQGTRIEIYPVDPSNPKIKRDNINVREKNIRDWDNLVDAWDAEDDDYFEDYWEDDIMSDLGSESDGYAYVSHVGF